MSSNRPMSEDEAYTDEGARIVREILNIDQLASADISPSGELYRRVARFHQGLRNGVNTDSQNQGGRNDNEIRARFRALMENRSGRRIRGQENEQRSREGNDVSRSRVSTTASPPIAVGSFTPSSSNRNASVVPAPWGSSDTSPEALIQTRLDRLQEQRERRQVHPLNRVAQDELGQQLESESSHLRALLREPMLIGSASRDIEQEYAEEAENNRAFKRRKLDAGVSGSNFKGFSYGHYGQVEPGKLIMEIESCDGGIYPEAYGGDYAAGNVLKNDDSVYCTKGNRCNLVLRHQAATTFCLQELIIQAPRKGFTAPVQQGMVFVSMTADDLLARTAHYQIQYSPVRQNTVTGQPVIPMRQNFDGENSQPHGTAQTQSRVSGTQSTERAYRLAQIPPEFHVPLHQPSFEVTTSSSDVEDNLIGSPRRRRDLVAGWRTSHRDALYEHSDTSSEDEEDSRNEQGVDDIYGWGAGRNASSRTPSVDGRRPITSSITTLPEPIISTPSKRYGPESAAGDLMAPHANFFIEQGKSKCTIRFDPPVSGRFVLLKMWSPRHRPGGNIDIQSVTVKGFAGPRFFPAHKMR